MRLKKLELYDVKNIRHGVISFRTQPTGGSVTGIYGQNGSGKTSVINAMQILRLLMSGSPLRGDVADVFIREGGSAANVHATFDTTLGEVDYAVVLTYGNEGMRITRETLELKPLDGQRTRRRTIADYMVEYDETSGLLKPTIRPVSQWNSLKSVGHLSSLFRQESALAFDQNRSMLFSPNFITYLENAKGQLKQAGASIPSAKGEAFDQILTPLLGIIAQLSSFAIDNMRIVTTREGATVCFGYTPLARGRGFDILDIGRPCVVPPEVRHAIEHMVQQANIVLPVVVPGLKLRCEMKDDVTENGEYGVRVFLHSVRSGVSIPFWAESEGIRRIVGILSLLIRMFNEPDVCVAVDEIDSGVFEILLGDLLQALAQRGCGQLVFTAHNLRALEMLPHDSIVFSTADPDRRFTDIKGVRDANNLRDVYIRTVSMGDSDIMLAEKVKQSHIAVALSRAGRVEQEA